jgi:myo-inositol-1(or 4)-monophosphatase
MHLEKILEKTIMLTKEVGEILRKNFYYDFKIYKKDQTEIVTDVDYEIEKKLITDLQKITPHFEIISEESYSKEKLKILKDLKYYWLIDPLDGTLNFVHRIPWFAISIALMEKENPILGIVYNPMTEECFYAVKNDGAYFNNSSIKVSNERKIENSLLCTSFPGDCKRKDFERCFVLFKEFNFISRGVRRFGSASLDLAYVACGKYDGFWEPYLKPWDTAAGILLVKEAGGKVTDYSGNSYNPFLETIVASNGLIHSEMIEIISKYY